jgi:hypothetical protein
MAKEVWEVTSQKRKLTEDEISILILIIAILLGGWFRFMPAWLAGFPVNDGGMFYAMMKDLMANHFVPPLYTTYNQLNIPFAYPPLALYIGAFLSSIFNLSGFEVLQWLPALVNSLTIPVFFLLAKEIIGDRFKSAIATLVFAFTPHLVEWLSMGGGLTRSFGTLFMMLTVFNSYKLFTQGQVKYIYLTILFGSLTALSHPESTVFAIVIPIIFWVFISRSFQGFKQGLMVAIGVIAFAGIWYGLVVFRYGYDPLFSALKTGAQNPLVFLRLFNIRKFTTESYADIIGVTGILGIIFLTAKKQYLIPTLFILIYITQPRSGHTIVNIPLALAAGIFIVDTILINFEQKKLFLTIMVLPFCLGNIIYQSYIVSLNHISSEDLEAFSWVNDNTPEKSRFLVLTGEMDAMCDSVGEWFPSLANRQSVTTVQGREWIAGEEFEDFLTQRISLERCLDEGLDCLKQEALSFEKTDYIYISQTIPVRYCNELTDFSPKTRLLIDVFKMSTEYEMQYQSVGVFIFKKK